MPGISNLFQIPGLLIPAQIIWNDLRLFNQQMDTQPTTMKKHLPEPKLAEYPAHKANLLDCYRIALDFGLPAAERAIDLMDKNITLNQHVDNSSTADS